MGIIKRVVKKLARRAGYHIGGAIGTAAGVYTEVPGADKVGRRAGHLIGKQAGIAAGKTMAKGISKIPVIGSLKKGGPIHKTGPYLLHKGEYVLSRKKAKKFFK